jgi:hypothetical protein
VIDPGPSSRRLRLLGIGAGLVLLLAVVAVASRGGIGGGSKAGPSTSYLSYAYTTFLIVFVLTIPVTLWALWMESSSVQAERPTFKRAVFQNLATLAILCLIVGGAVYLHKHGHFTFHRPDTRGLRNTKNALTQHGNKPVKVEPTFKWPVLWVALALLAIASVPLLHTYRRNKARRAARRALEPMLADELSDEISLALDDLREERDIRRAIIAAYARMEAVLARSGLRRRPSETAFEYLRRVLRDLRVSPLAAEGLTGLFEEAKFSRHELGEDARTRAIGALETVRSDLLAEPA